MRSLAAAALLALAAPPAPGAPGRPAAGDKCPVCGMFVARYPDWAAAVVFEDGGLAWFDGAKDLFEFLLRPERHGGARPPRAVARVLVTDYYAVRLVDARAAWFVVGSDVHGPMGRELVPFASEAEAREFAADHLGTGLLRFGDVEAATLERLEEPP